MLTPGQFREATPDLLMDLIILFDLLKATSSSQTETIISIISSKGRVHRIEIYLYSDQTRLSETAA
jgi:hypothetical protein